MTTPKSIIWILFSFHFILVTCLICKFQQTHTRTCICMCMCIYKNQPNARTLVIIVINCNHFCSHRLFFKYLHGKKRSDWRIYLHLGHLNHIIASLTAWFDQSEKLAIDVRYIIFAKYVVVSSYITVITFVFCFLLLLFYVVGVNWRKSLSSSHRLCQSIVSRPFFFFSSVHETKPNQTNQTNQLVCKIEFLVFFSMLKSICRSGMNSASRIAL